MSNDVVTVLAEVSSSTLSAPDLRGKLNKYLLRIQDLQKNGGTFAANSAKAEGPALIKVVNLCLRQAGASKEDERAAVLLHAAGRGIEFLRGMQSSLTCSPFDLEKLAQNVVHKLIERGRSAEARATTETMVLKLFSLKFQGKENTKSKGQTRTWREALEALLDAPKDEKKKSNKDETALLLGCVINTLTLETQSWTTKSGELLQSLCGRRSLIFLKELIAADDDMGKRLAGSFYRQATKAATLVDAELKDDGKSISGSSGLGQEVTKQRPCGSHLVQVSRALREMGLVFLLMSERVKATEIVQQAVKTARFYETRVQGMAEIEEFHLHLLDEMEDALISRHAGSEGLLCLLDWMLSAVASSVKGARSGAGGRGGATLLERFSVAVNRMLGASSATHRERQADMIAAVQLLLRAAVGLHVRKSQAERKAEAELLREAAGKVAVFWSSKSEAGSLDEQWLARLGRSLDVLRSGCTAILAPSRAGGATVPPGEARARWEASGAAIQKLMTDQARWLLDHGSRTEERVAKSVECLMTSLQLEPFGTAKGVAMQLLAKAMEDGGAGVAKTAVQASASLFNLAVLHYNSGSMEAAMEPLKLACEVVMGEEGQRMRQGPVLEAEESAQMSKRVRMLTYLLHRDGHVREALAWASAVVAMLVHVRDMAGTAGALEEYYTLLGSGDGEKGAPSRGVTVALVDALDSELAMEALMLELRVGLRAKVPPVQALGGVCEMLLENELLTRESNPLGRARVLLERCKLQRAGSILAQSSENAGEEGKAAARKGGRSKAAARKGSAFASASADGEQRMVDGVEAVVELLGRAAATVGEGLHLAEVCQEMAIALTWKAVALLDVGWAGARGAAHAAVEALQLWDGYCDAVLHGDETAPVHEGGEDRMFENIQLLADLLALHGQESLSLHAKRCAAAMLCRGCVGNADNSEWGNVRKAYLGRLAVDYGLKGYRDMARMCVETLKEEVEAGAKTWEKSLVTIASAAAMIAAGEGGMALEICKDVEAEAKCKFQGVKKEQTGPNSVGADELVSMLASVRCEALVQAGDGVGALRDAVSALHAQLYPVRRILKRQDAARSEDARNEDGAVRSGQHAGMDPGRLGEAVKNGGREASGWRVIEQVCERLWRVGELHVRMGMGREGLYYLGEGVELGAGCGSLAWKVRFGGMLAELKGLMGQEEGKEGWTEAMALLEEAGAVEAPSLAFLEADRARLLMQGRQWVGADHGWGAVRKRLEEAEERVARAVRQEGGEGVAVGSCLDVSRSPESSMILKGLRASGGQAQAREGGRKPKGKQRTIEAIGRRVGHTEVSRRLLCLRSAVGVRLAEAMIEDGMMEDARGKAEEAVCTAPPGDAWVKAEGLCVLGRCLGGGAHKEGIELALAKMSIADALEEEGCCDQQTEDDELLEKMTVVQLKAKLTQLALPTTGKKAELIARVRDSTANSTSKARPKVVVKQPKREATAGGSGGAEISGADAVQMWTEAWRLVHPNGPPLLIKTCARLLLCGGGTQSGQESIDSAFLAMASIGVTVRQQSRLCERMEERGRPDHLDEACESVEAISIREERPGSRVRRAEGADVRDIVEMTAGDSSGRGWVRWLQSRLPSTWAVVVVKADRGPAEGAIALRVMRIEREGEVQGVRLAGDVVVKFEALLDEFDKIMHESKTGLEGGGTVTGDEEKKQWWQARMALDRRLGSVLQQLERDVLADGAQLFAPPGSVGHGHLVLVLDESVQQLPWESMASIKASSVSRVPSAAILGYLLAEGAAEKEVDSSEGYYVLNPGGDLSDTQAKFEAAFRMQPWEGVVGTAPAEDELARFLEKEGVFVFCGHGAGERYVRGERVRALHKCAAAVLMGCGSARLKPQGALEPRGMVLNYMLGGCPLAIGNLWDVSDRDIDRFADCLLRRAVLPVQPPAEPSSSAAGASEPSKSLNFSEAVEERSNLVQGVAAARGAVRMKHLIGAAPVCFGIPVACVSGCPLTAGRQSAVRA